MNLFDVPMLAGTVSTVLFVSSYLPMLVKAFRTHDLESYSLANLVIANVGNGVYSVYVFSLPPGPIWVLHGFYLCSTAMMLVWHRMFVRREPATAPANHGERLPTQGGRRVPSGSH